MTASSYVGFYKKFNKVYGLNLEILTNTTLKVHSGYCMDDEVTMNIYADNELTIDSSINGLNGLDTGDLEASKIYYVYLLAPRLRRDNPTKAMISLSATAPVVPLDYSAKKIIGFVLTDSSTHFIPFKQIGESNKKEYFLHTPINILDEGAETSYTNIDLASYIPKISTEVKVNFFTGGTSGTASLAMLNSSSDFISTAQADASIQVTIPAELISTTGIGFKYKVTDTLTASINLQSFVHEI